MQHYAAFHLGIHCLQCLQKYSFRGLKNKKGKFLILCYCFQNTQKWLTEQRKLAKHTDEVDYDVEGKGT